MVVFRVNYVYIIHLENFKNEYNIIIYSSLWPKTLRRLKNRVLCTQR